MSGPCWPVAPLGVQGREFSVLSSMLFVNTKRNPHSPSILMPRVWAFLEWPEERPNRGHPCISGTPLGSVYIRKLTRKQNSKPLGLEGCSLRLPAWGETDPCSQLISGMSGRAGHTH